MKRIHAHPIMILGNLWRVLYLIIIPVIRGFIAALRNGLAGWAAGAWMDLLVVLVMIAIAVTRWWHVELTWDHSALHLRQGVFFTRHSLVPWDRIVTLSETRPYYLRPVGASRVRVDTIGGGNRDADFAVLLSHRNASTLMERGHSGGDVWGEYRPATGAILALSLFNSNSLAGIVFIAAFISQSGRLLGVEFSRRLIDTFEEAARIWAFGIPPAAAAIAYALLIGWAVGFVLSFFRYKNIIISHRGEHFHIWGGMLSKREYLVRYDEINFIDVRQTLLSKIIGLFSLYVSAVGYGKQKEDITCLIPTEGKDTFQKSCASLFPALEPSPRMLAAQREGIFRFIGQPLAACFGVPAVTALVIWRVEGWTSFALFTGIMALVPSLFFLVIRILEYRTSGIALKNDVYTLRYSKGFTLHTAVFSRDKLVQLELSQSIFQRRGSCCDVLFRTRGEGKVIHRCRSIRLEDAKKLFASQAQL